MTETSTGISAEEWDDFQTFFSLALMQDSTRRMGSMFVQWFPDIARSIKISENLKTLSGVQYTTDNVILDEIINNIDAKSFILDKVEIT
jgi:hypothetical protein